MLDILIEIVLPFVLSALVVIVITIIAEKYGTKTGKVLSNLQKSGVQTCIDFISPSQENLFKFYRYRKTIKYVDICCINEDQAGALTEIPNPEQACQALVDKLGAKIAIVHCGAEGPNYAYTKQDGLLIQQNFKVAEEDYKGNAGAGDAFTAAMIFARLRDWPLPRIAEFANRVGAIVASRQGAMPEVESDYRKLLAQFERD